MYHRVTTRLSLKLLVSITSVRIQILFSVSGTTSELARIKKEENPAIVDTPALAATNRGIVADEVRRSRLIGGQP